ncbi:MAG TPA: hypothetical protein VGN80_02940 [Devosiaceae bacterium]|jgi:hypothetical protein|nr:hypothetical protein [Devosiaceae bacterium]
MRTEAESPKPATRHNRKSKAANGGDMDATEDQPVLDEVDPGDDGLAVPGAPPARSVVSADYKREHKPDDLGQRLSKAVAGAGGKVDRNKLRAVAVANGVWNPAYENLNPGQARMNVGNRLRAKVKRGERVKWR